ncbi:MAG TPA: MarR family transcriptional regulator [Candidatus Alistipes avicola]|uniref:MarR family transcriptional regulator n=1 Tax=Candidatus Alistipes avicola TaxID=2838432 RepID=A0A9D2L4P6_9BACT|nr:MarR family transcriptional regulator [uncultured Alistipes sp.]HJA99235.1 MarR family transcriptional regulator [Candidatus Alistipes avicola]
MEGGDDFREFQLQVVRMRIAFRQCLQRTLRRHGVNVTFETLQVLSCLWREQGATQQMLAERTARSKASLSSLMNTLEKRGYIERCVGPSDRRNKQVFLSREGERFWLQILPIINELYLRFEQSIGRDRLRDISSDLKRIQNELENL